MDRDNENMPRMATVKIDIVSFPEMGLPPAFRVAITTQTGTVYWLPDLSPTANQFEPKNQLARAAYELALDAWTMKG